ncbi:helix-turn-helix domain-containing protein [Paenibacillus sp. GCM10023248]|uniref:AraC family transcriptional regulator n=1 Tax=Bacillales TaxID=1385 RepID=UPI0023786419|nr:MULTISPECIES: AraC family transcriptional regulator [Bacillales]MDD9272250.1 AraC family transcriptional regulator [Paenibacillus sp. MAHUQ-63]MDR6885377.1 AraC-like DNA-binding protein [Bacillus sp. 3255]
MGPIRKIFDNQDTFPFSYAYKNTKSSQSELPDHLHDWYEIVYVYRGNGTFFIDHTFYEMKAGDVFLIPGNTIHRATPDKETPVTSTAVYFSPGLVQAPQLGDTFSYLHSFEQAAQLRHYKLATLLPQRQHLEHCWDAIRHELKLRSPGHRQAVYVQLLQVLLYLQRDIGSDMPLHTGDPLAAPGWMRESLLYIDEHFCEDIGLNTLSKQAAVSPAHFSRVFKQLTGLNVTAYIMTKRIIRAKQLLAESDTTIQHIAELCGFESLPHFHAMFKRVLGMTPAAARKAFK